MARHHRPAQRQRAGCRYARFRRPTAAPARRAEPSRGPQRNSAGPAARRRGAPRSGGLAERQHVDQSRPECCHAALRPAAVRARATAPGRFAARHASSRPASASPRHQRARQHDGVAAIVAALLGERRGIERLVQRQRSAGQQPRQQVSASPRTSWWCIRRGSSRHPPVRPSSTTARPPAISSMWLRATAISHRRSRRRSRPRHGRPDCRRVDRGSGSSRGAAAIRSSSGITPSGRFVAEAADIADRENLGRDVHRRDSQWSAAPIARAGDDRLVRRRG